MKKIYLKIKRQDTPEGTPGWEDFAIDYRPGMNVISCLMEIQNNPVNAKGEKTTPVAWDCSCLEEVCGACSMIINGKVRQACSTLIDKIDQPVTLEPMSKFPTVRDLKVDRERMFDALKKVRAWVPIDGTHNLGAGPRISAKQQQILYDLSRCMTCGCCVEACPQVNDSSDFMGAFVISQVRLFNGHPTGKMNSDERLDALMGPDGISNCGNAQNCVEACPKDIPLATSISEVERQMTGRLFRKILG